MHGRQVRAPQVLSSKYQNHFASQRRWTTGAIATQGSSQPPIACPAHAFYSKAQPIAAATPTAAHGVLQPLLAELQQGSLRRRVGSRCVSGASRRARHHRGGPAGRSGGWEAWVLATTRENMWGRVRVHADGLGIMATIGVHGIGCEWGIGPLSVHSLISLRTATPSPAHLSTSRPQPPRPPEPAVPALAPAASSGSPS